MGIAKTGCGKSHDLNIDKVKVARYKAEGVKSKSLLI
jgi:hypothetical protein